MSSLALKFNFIILAVSMLLTACTTTTRPSEPSSVMTSQATNAKYIDKAAKALYLLGSFNLWHHQAEYQLIATSPKTYAASARLTKGQNYEFMFAAKDSSQPYANCGHQGKDTLELNQRAKASCNNVVLENFVFIPPHSAVYEFFIEMHSLNHPMVYIKRAY